LQPLLQPPLLELLPLVRQQPVHRQEPEPPEAMPPVVRAVPVQVMLARLQTSMLVTKNMKTDVVLVAIVGESGDDAG
jgi:hypothetical protein